MEFHGRTNSLPILGSSTGATDHFTLTRDLTQTWDPTTHVTTTAFWRQNNNEHAASQQQLCSNCRHSYSHSIFRQVEKAVEKRHWEL